MLRRKEIVIYLTIFFALLTGIFIYMPATAREEQNNPSLNNPSSPPFTKGGLSPPLVKGDLGGLSTGEVEDIQGIMKALENRERELSRREDALRKEEERLNMLKSAIEQSLKEYSAMRDRLQKGLSANPAMNNQAEQGIGHIVKMYESMSAEDAAQRIDKMDSLMAVELLSRIKSKKAGKILGAMSTDKAALFSEKIAGKAVPALSEAKKGDK